MKGLPPKKKFIGTNQMDPRVSHRQSSYRAIFPRMGDDEFYNEIQGILKEEKAKKAQAREAKGCGWKTLDPRTKRCSTT
jgi:hypothetical protein